MEELTRRQETAAVKAIYVHQDDDALANALEGI